MNAYNLNLIRNEFPGLQNEWTFFDNAGGSQILGKVISRLEEYLTNSNVQLGGTYGVSRDAGNKVLAANDFVSSFVNAKSKNEIILGSSTTMLLRLLAESFGKTLKPGDEIITTNCDHEANIGPWVNLSAKGVKIKFWQLNKDSLNLEIEDLLALLTDKTKLVAFTNASNILGSVNPVKKITSLVHKYGAKVCVDGVAFAPHRRIDVNDTDVDFYALSFYKVYGPHIAMLYGKSEALLPLPGLNHYFIAEDQIPSKFQPGGQNYELSFSLLGIKDYFDFIVKPPESGQIVSKKENIVAKFYDYISTHENRLTERFLDFTGSKNNIRVIGDKDFVLEKRLPTISFVVEGINSDKIAREVDKYKIGIRYGHFYAKRLIDFLELEKFNGVVRVSMVHYNSLEEVDKLVKILDKII